jgi:hypothetical protein
MLCSIDKESMQYETLLGTNLSAVSGWLATALMLATFQCEAPQRMRLLALGANVCFIIYGATNNLLPVVILHTILFPINLHKLMALGCSVGGPGKDNSVAK